MRFEGDYDEEFPGQYMLWEANLERHFSGKAGQAKLRELRDALLALPEKRLIETRLADEKGNVCALGALAVQHHVAQGKDRAVALAEMAEAVPDEGGWVDTYEAEQHTKDESERCGCKAPFIYTVAYENDFGPSSKETPEERYARMLRWVEKRILPTT